MDRKLPGNYWPKDYRFTLVATGGDKELFDKAIPRVLKQRSGFREPPREGFTIYYGSDGSYWTPSFFTARDEASGLELDVYGESNMDTASFAQSLGLLTTPLLKAGYTISIADRSKEIHESRDRKIFF